MDIHFADTDAEIAACFPVMLELRPHLIENEFVRRIREQEESGYRMVYVQTGDEVVAVAGFRTGNNLAWGHFLYVDDLVTMSSQRSQGHGRALLNWLKEHARRAGCQQLHLESGMQRKDAHRFYQREGMTATGFHFAEPLDS